VLDVVVTNRQVVLDKSTASLEAQVGLFNTVKSAVHPMGALVQNCTGSGVRQAFVCRCHRLQHSRSHRNPRPWLVKDGTKCVNGREKTHRSRPLYGIGEPK
jgi:hypothetical protein